jgi:hypothetical protein
VKNFIASDFSSVFDILIDADNNSLTAPLGLVSNPTNGGGPIGVDFIATVERADSVGPVTLGGFRLSSGLQILDNAAVSVRPAASLGQTGLFTMSIPLSLIGGNPASVRLYVGAGDYLAGQGDIGPAAPLVVPVAGDVLPPVVLSSSFDFNAPKPRIRVQFSEDVSASLTKEDLNLLNTTTGQTIAASSIALVYDKSTQTATFTFPGLTGSLPDGNYRARIAAGSVSDAAGNPLPTDFTLNFSVLAGDADGDHAVGFADLVAVAQHYGTMSGATVAQGDFNYDGAVDFSDLVMVAQKYGTSLPAAGVGVAAGEEVAGVKALFSVKLIRPVSQVARVMVRRR